MLEWVKLYLHSKVTYFDCINIEKFCRFDLDAIPSYLGYPLPCGFWFKKPRMILDTRFVRITNDKETLEMVELVLKDNEKLRFISNYLCQPNT